MAKIGDLGTVVEIYKAEAEGLPDGYEVECCSAEGATSWLATFHREDLEPLNRLELKMASGKYEYGEDFEEVQIFIDGQSLIGILREIERPLVEQENPSTVPGDYRGLNKRFITRHHFLGQPDIFYGKAEDKIALLDCPCGVAGCWTFAAKITETADAFVWSDFEQIHRNGETSEVPWGYHHALGSFVFDKREYLEEVRKLEKR